MHCPSCNTANPDNANFCLNCGISLKQQSDSVKRGETARSSADDSLTQMLKRLMPTSYAEKLFASKGRMQGERRIVTILFSDVKGSTAIAENLDPEEVLELMNDAFSVLIKPIMKYEGTIARLMGDAILAFFGAPVAHEDDPFRACRAALDILEGAGEFSKKLELEKGIKGFGVRVGINTGLVVVGEVGTDFRGEYTAMGDEVNVAARMESAAEPGTILITESTGNLVKNDFELLSLGPIKVKGKSEPINTYRVLDIKRSGNAQVHSSVFNSPLVGRDKELNELQSSLRRLHQGKGGIVSIIGDNGFGKSRLVSEVRKSEFPDLKWVGSKALAYNVNSSYWMFRSFLKNFLGFHQESLDDAILEKLYKRVQKGFGDKLDDIYPFIEHFFWPSCETKTLSNIALNDSRSIQGQFHYAFREFLKKESEKKPVVLVLEDLQWCDSPSLDLVNELFPLINQYPVLFLFTYRISENEKVIWNFHNKILGDYVDGHKVIPVHPLKEDECVTLINNILGDRFLPLEIREKVIRKTEGNPAFLEEVLHSITELGFFTMEKSSSANLKLENMFRIPNLLQNSIMARVDILDPYDKMVLQTASVIGRLFHKNLLAKVLQDKMNSSDFEKSVNELQIREFILRHLPANLSSGKISFEKEYIFKQETVQNVIYNSLLMTHRQSLHKQIGEEIENIHSENIEEFADSLALHFEKGKIFDKAVHYNKIAAGRAKKFFANDDAIHFYLKALELSEKSPLKSTGLAEIHEAIGDIYSIKAEYSKSIDHYKVSLTFIKHSGTIAKVHYKIGQVFERWGQYDKALENYKKGLTLIHNENEKILMACIFAGIGMVYFRKGDLDQALNLNVKALVSLNHQKNEAYIADIYNNMGIIYGKLGNWEKSLEFHKKCLNIRQDMGSSGGLAAANNNLGFLYQLKNENEKAVEYYTRSLEYWEKIGNLHGLARTYDNLSQIYITQGNDELGMDYNLKAVAILGKIAGDSSQINSDLWLQSGVW